MIGKIGRVTGTIKPGEIGEVMISIEGGTSAFHAYPYDGEASYPIGMQVLVVDFTPPQTVYVEDLPEFLRTELPS